MTLGGSLVMGEGSIFRCEHVAGEGDGALGHGIRGHMGGRQ